MWFSSDSKTLASEVNGGPCCIYQLEHDSSVWTEGTFVLSRIQISLDLHIYGSVRCTGETVDPDVWLSR